MSSTSTFAEFLISLTRKNDGSFGLTWSARSPQSNNRTDGTRPQQITLQAETFLALENDPASYGQALSAALFADAELGNAWSEVRAQSRDSGVALRLRISFDSTDSFLNSLRWEELADPLHDSYQPITFDETVLLSRYPTSPQAIAPAAESRRNISALIVIANPTNHGTYNLAPIDAVGEQQRILAALGSEVQAQILCRDSAEVGRQPTLENLLAQLRAAPPTILYIVCHGSMVGGDYYLWLEDATGQAARVLGSDLAASIAGMQRRPLVAILAACESSLPARTALMALGPALAVAGVGAVLAMQGKIAISTATRMMPRLFAELGRHGEVDRAVVAARSEVRAEHDWWMPALFLRIEDGRIWRQNEPAGGLSRRQLAAFGATALVVLIALAAILWLQLAPRFAGPTPMTGGFRIAVARFGRIGPDGNAHQAPEGDDLAQVAYDQVATEAQQLAASTGLDLRVNPPTQTGWAADEVMASQLATDLRADLLIFGAIGADGHSFTPRFILTERLLAAQPEITGAFTFGSAIQSRADVANNPVALQDLVNKLNPQATALTQLIVGIAYYTLDDREQAMAQFEAANQQWQDPKGREIVLLLLGNTAGQMMNYNVAADYYTEALSLNPEFARAQIGNAEVLFQQSRGSGTETCTLKGIDEERLNQAAAAFDHALSAADQPQTADIPSKVAFGRARVFRCLALATGQPEQVNQAQIGFQTVIDAYAAGNQRIKGRAAQAHAGLGQLLVSFQHNADARVDYRNALSEYTQATELIETLDLKATYLGWQAYIHILLGECAEADRALQAADDTYAQYRSFGQTYASFETWRAELVRQRATCKPGP